MSVTRYIRELTRGSDGAHDLTEEDAHDLFAAMLDGGVPDLELGACLTALRIKSGSAAELLGFYRAASERLYTLRTPATSLRPLVFATYNGARHEPNLLSLRNRLGVRNPAHYLVKLLDPFEGAGLRVISAFQTQHLAEAEAFFAATGFDALLLRSTEGESFANPRQRPKIQLFRHGDASVLFEEEMAPAKHIPSQPASIDAAVTAQWIRQALAGRVPVPHPLVNQLACCLYAAGYTEDMNQAKAIAVAEVGGLTASTAGRTAEGVGPRTNT